MRHLDLTRAGKFPDWEHDQSLKWIDGANEAVLALGRIYPAGFKVPAHSHARTQLWFARSGVVLVMTADGRWMVPPGHGLFIPAGLEHATEMISDVSMHSIYVDPDTPGAHGPRVVEVSALARSLIEDLVVSEGNATSDRRIGLVTDLLLDEMGRLVERPLGLPFPSDARLAGLCRTYLRLPAANARIEDWADRLGMSRRTFTRFFRSETGVSFVTWRQQAIIFLSLPRLLRGEAVTRVAFEAGYETVSAFSTMFRRMLGRSPGDYRR